MPPQDGDLDANWVESMNSVMDDSRLLTLPSNERIRLLPHMKARVRARAPPARVRRAAGAPAVHAAGAAPPLPNARREPPPPPPRLPPPAPPR